jgi:AcrR family transcriptional regulator
MIVIISEGRKARMTGRSKGSAETRQRIIQAALEAFMHHGYHGTTMDDVAAQSGTSKGTLYWYFESKEDLLETAVRELFAGAFGEEALSELDTYTSASDKLRALGQSMIAFMHEVQELVALFLEFWASSPQRDHVADLWMDLLVEYKDTVTTIIEVGIETGEFRSVDAEALVWALLSTYDGLAIYWMFEPTLDLQYIHEIYLETVLRGLEAER